MSMLFVSKDLCLQVLGSITLGFLGFQWSQVLCVHALCERGTLPPGSWEHNIRLSGSQLSQVLCVHALRERGSLHPGSWEHNITLLIHQLTPAQILYISGIFL